MALITRISRLFTADLHAVLDRIEEPDVLLRQAVREMEEELARGEQRLKWLAQERRQLDSRARGLDESLAELERELDVCFDSGKPELARGLIRRRIERERQARALAAGRESTERTLAELRAALEEQRSVLDGMRQKAELLVDKACAAQPDGTAGWPAGEFTVSEEEVEIALLREQQRRRQS